MRKRNLERMRYKDDTLAANMCLLAIVFDVAHFIILYSSTSIVPDYQMGIDIIINILFLLIAFLASEEAKVYSRKWAFVIMGVAVVQAARMFWLPLAYHGLGQLEGAGYLAACLSILVSAVFMLAGGIICYVNASALQKYLDKLGA